MPDQTKTSSTLDQAVEQAIESYRALRTGPGKLSSATVLGILARAYRHRDPVTLHAIIAAVLTEADIEDERSAAELATMRARTFVTANLETHATAVQA